MLSWTVRNAAPIFMAAFAILLFGAWSYTSLPMESSPDVNVPFVAVNSLYMGASPGDVESLVTVPIENELAGVEGLEEMSSTSSEGVSSIFLEFATDVDIDAALTQVRDRVERARPRLPADAEDPSVRELSFTDVPVLIVTLAGPVDQTVLKRLVDDLDEEASRIPGVLGTDISGGAERELRVLVDPVQLQHFDMTLDDVVNALGRENLNLPAGDVASGAGNLLVRVPATLEDGLDVGRVPLGERGGSVVQVRDVARVEDDLAPASTYARMNGQPAVSLRVKKSTGANIVEVADAVKALVEAQSEDWPAAVEYRILGDQSVQIRNLVRELQNNVITALLLVVGVLVLFMGTRDSLLVAIAIPLSMLASFIVLSAAGFTLNMVVLFSLILALGMLVDNAIVVVENVHRHLELGKDPFRAAIDGTGEVSLAVAASTATTVAAFLPMVFWDGILGQFMGYLPRTLIVVLLASLGVAVLLLPVFASRFLRPARRIEGEDPEAAAARMAQEERERVEQPGRWMGAYKGVLTAAIRHRYLTLLTFAGLLVGTVAVYATFNHGTEFFPTTEPDRAVIGVRGADGSDLDTTDDSVRQIEALLDAEANVDVYVSEIGVQAGTNGALRGDGKAPHSARISVDFLPHAANAEPHEPTRVESTHETVRRLRTVLDEVVGVQVTVTPESRSPPVGSAIEVSVRGPDLDTAGDVAQQLRREIARIDGITGLSDDYRVDRPELALRIDRTAARQAGVSTVVVGSTVRTAIAGSTATTVRDGSEDVEVRVALAPEHVEDAQDVLALTVPGRMPRDPAVYPVPLSSVATYDLAGGAGAVRHTNQDLTVTILGDVVEGADTNALQRQVRDLIEGFDFPPGTGAELGGASTAQADATAFLVWAMAVAVVLIAIVLVAQFNDFLQPLIVLFTVVLSLIGVLWGLLVTGTPFGVMMTGIGVISLAGIVVNNAIVLLDTVAQLERQGLESRDAIVQAGMTRFRPVMLTAATTVLGLVPMALGLALDVQLWWVGDVVPIPTLGVVFGSPSSAFWGPMAIAVVFGLSFATVLTLVVVPSLMQIVVDGKRWLGKRRSGGTAAFVGEGATTAAALGLVLTGALAAGLVSTPARAATVDEAWAATVAHNPELALAHEQALQSAEQRRRAVALVQPKVSGAVNYTRISYGDVELDLGELIPAVPGAPTPEPIVVQRGSNWDARLTVSQPLFDAQALPAIRGATRAAEAAELDEQRTLEQVRAGVVHAMLAVQAARESEQLAEGARTLATSQQGLAARRVAAGLEPDHTALQAELAVANAERDLRRAREQRASAERAFARLTGLPTTEPVQIRIAIERPASLDQALAEALATRVDREATELRAAAARMQVSAERLGWAPDVSASLSTLYNQTPGFAGQNSFWTVGVSMTGVLWDGGARVASIRTASSARRQADAVARALDLDIHDEVVAAWEALERAEVGRDAADTEVQVARSAMAAAESGYAAGTLTWLDLEQSRLGLRRAELHQLTERVGVDHALVDLELALGGA